MATYYTITGGGNWSSAGTWNTASNQAVGNAPNAPLATDTVILDAPAGQVTVDTTTCVCAVLTATAYANTLTFTAGQILTVTGNTGFSAGMTIAGTGKLVIGSGSTTCAFTTGGKTLTGDFSTAGTGAKTFTGNLTVNGIYTKTSTHAMNGAYTMTIVGGATFNATSTGTLTYTLTGGTWSFGGVFGVANPMNIAGNVVFGANVYKSGSLTYVSGTPDTTTNNSILNVTATLTVNGFTNQLNNVDIIGASATTFAWTGNLNLQGYIANNSSGSNGTLQGTILYVKNGINTTSGWEMQGSVEVWIQGGTWRGNMNVTKIVFDGNSAISTYDYLGSGGGAGIRSSILAWNSGTITTAGTTLKMISTGSPTISTGSNVIFDDINSYSCAITLTADLYVGTLSVTTSGSVMQLNGAYTVWCSGGTRYYSTVATNPNSIVGTATLRITGGTIANPWSSPLQCNFDINVILDSASTITFKSGNITHWGTTNYTLTYIRGTIITTGHTIQIIGNQKFSANMNVELLDMTTAGVTLTLLDNFSCTTLRQIAGSIITYNSPSVTLTVGTNLYINGTDTTAATMSAVQSCIDPVGGNNVTGFSYLGEPIGSGNGSGVYSASTGTFSTVVNFGSTFTIAFTVYQSTTGTKNIFIKSIATRINLTGSLLNASFASGKVTYGTLVTDPRGTHRYVITKESAEQSAKLYQDGVLLTNDPSSNDCTGLSIDGITSLGSGFTGNIDSAVSFSDVKDQTWVTNDYNGGLPLEYTGAEANCTHVWNFSRPKLTYSGTFANQKVFAGTFTSIDASGSALPIYTYQGSATGCTKIKAVTGADIGGAGITITNY